MPKIKDILTALDPNATFKSRTKRVATWVGIFFGTLTIIFILLLLSTKLQSVFAYSSVHVEGYQLPCRNNFTIISSENEEIGFGLELIITLSGVRIPVKSMPKYGLNVSFCPVWTGQ